MQVEFITPSMPTFHDELPVCLRGSVLREHQVLLKHGVYNQVHKTTKPLQVGSGSIVYLKNGYHNQPARQIHST